MEIKAQDIPPLVVTVWNNHRVVYGQGIHGSEPLERQFATHEEAKDFAQSLYADDKAIREAAAQ